MNFQELVKVFTVLLTSATKLAFAPPLALGLGYSLLLSIVFLLIGSTIGVLFFYFLGDFIHQVNKRIRHYFFKNHTPKRFGRMSRIIVRVRRKMGLWGLALITPTIISIPLGSFLIHRLYHKSSKAIWILLFCAWSWSILMTILWSFVF